MTKRDVNNEACPICGNIPYDHERRVLVHRRRRISYCSQACLRVGVRTTQIAQRQARRRAYAILAGFALLIAGVGYVRHLARTWRRSHAPIAAAPAPLAPAPPPEPTPFGPHWPPTDEDWLAEFTHTPWVYPLPGPTRHPPATSRPLLVLEPTKAAAKAKTPPPPPARCRSEGRCGVELGGELWGEHVYAAHDGVVDRVQRSDDEAHGGVSVRIAHWGGAVFTQYSHLAAVPLRLGPGVHVAAGDVIGLAGDGTRADAHAHLHFALSVRPSSDSPEVYWDPEPLMSDWPLRTPGRGSVAGLVTAEAAPEPIATMTTPPHPHPHRTKGP